MNGASTAAASNGFEVELSTAAPRQGGVVAIVVTSASPLPEVVVKDGDRRVALERSGSGTVFRGLLGVDLDSPAGERTLVVEGDGLVVRERVNVLDGRFEVEKLRVPRDYVEPPKRVLARIKEDQRKVAAAWASALPDRLWAGKLRQPVDAPVRDNFGRKRVLNGTPKSPHNGIDFPAATGTAVVASAAARVALAEALYFSGNSILLDHGNGLFTTYFHLSKLDVKAGDRVKPGQRIGAVGATGRVTGLHLHMGARLHGARVSPLALFALPEWPAAP